MLILYYAKVGLSTYLGFNLVFIEEGVQTICFRFIIQRNTYKIVYQRNAVFYFLIRIFFSFKVFGLFDKQKKKKILER